MSKLPAGLTKRGNIFWGSWWEGGQRIRKSLDTSDRDEALRRFRAKRAANPPKRSNGPTFAEVGQIYLDVLRDRTDKWRTIQSCEGALRVLNRWLGDLPVRDIEEHHYKAFLKERAPKVAAGTLARDQRYLKAVLRHAVETKVIPELPFRVKIKASKKTKGRFLTPEQMKGLLSQAPPKAHVLMRLALISGLRKGEMIHLQWADVDLDNGHIVVRSKPELNWSPKSHAERSVPLTPDSVVWLKEYRETLNFSGDADFVIQKDPQTGEPWNEKSETYISALVRKCFERAGLYKKGMRPGLHLLRASYATLLLEAGASLETVRDLLGHCSVTVTERYLFTTEDSKRAAIKALDFLD